MSSRLTSEPRWVLARVTAHVISFCTAETTFGEGMIGFSLSERMSSRLTPEPRWVLARVTAHVISFCTVQTVMLIDVCMRARACVCVCVCV